MRILVIAAHPDDAELAIGGTMAKLVKSGHECKLLIAVIPCELNDGTISSEHKMVRRSECIKSAQILGVELVILDLDPYQLWFKRDIVKLLDKEAKSFNPDIIFTHWDHDSHQDHIALSNASFAIARKNTTSLIMYEQLISGGITPYSFQPNIYLDISDVMDIKLKSAETYEKEEQRGRQWLKAIEGVAAFRGNQIGTKYAEAYHGVKLLLDMYHGNFCIKH